MNVIKTDVKGHKNKRIILAVIAVVLALIAGATAIYVNDYYHADDNTISLYNSVLDNLSDNDGVSKVLTKELKCGDIAYISEDMSYMEGVMLIMECMDSRRVMVQRL